MAKKKLIEEDEEMDELENTSYEDRTFEKLPVDISGGRTPRRDCVDIPVDQLVPFSGKEGKDFRRFDSWLREAMVHSIQTDGVMELLTVRPLKNTTSFEILAGESRWLAAKEAGEKTVPCRVVNVDDDRAHKIFAMTNLLRRTLKPSDKVRGYWHYYEAMKNAGKLAELREGNADADVQASLGLSGQKINYRTVMDYVNLNALLPEWLDRLDDGTVTLGAANCIASFPADIQQLFLPYVVPESDAKALLESYEGKHPTVVWSNDLISQVLKPLKKAKQDSGAEGTDEAEDANGQTGEAGNGDTSQDAPQSESSQNADAYMQLKQFKKVRRSIIAAAQTGIRPDDYAKAAEVVTDALNLYYAEPVIREELRPDDYERADEVIKEALRMYYGQQSSENQEQQDG